MEDWLEREEILLGPGALEKLAKARVAVVGVGGVGGYAAEMLVRAGVGHLLLVDGDTVASSNRNRQLCALTSTLERCKTAVLAERFRDINPAVEIRCEERFLMPSEIPDFLDGAGRLDYLVDAIDTVAPKTTLLASCVRKGIPVVSAMGAGARRDATAIRLEDLFKTSGDPLAALIRKRLRKEGIRSGILAVYSTELPDPEGLIPGDGPRRRSVLGTVSYLPPVFGCVCAQAVLRALV